MTKPFRLAITLAALIGVAPALSACHTTAGVGQDLSQGGYFRGRKSDDGRIDWGKGAREIHDLVRAVAPPYPGAFTLLGAQKLRLLRTCLMPARAAPASNARMAC